MAPEDQLACTETLYFSSWVGDRRTDRRIAGRYTRMMVHEAFKTARMDRPGDTAIDSSRASENWRWRDSPRAWSPCHFSKKESTRTRLAPLEESRRLATTWEVKPPQCGAACTPTRLDVRDRNTRHGIRQRKGSTAGAAYGIRESHGAAGCNVANDAVCDNEAG
jgi:hypothetical protein